MYSQINLKTVVLSLWHVIVHKLRYMNDLSKGRTNLNWYHYGKHTFGVHTISVWILSSGFPTFFHSAFCSETLKGFTHNSQKNRTKIKVLFPPSHRSTGRRQSISMMIDLPFGCSICGRIFTNFTNERTAAVDMWLDIWIWILSRSVLD